MRVREPLANSARQTNVGLCLESGGNLGMA